MQPQSVAVAFVEFLVIVVLITYVASRFRVPYTIAMVIVGLGVSLLHVNLGIEKFQLQPDLILLVLLPGLLFEASYHLDVRLLRRHLWPISLMALLGVVLSTAIIGGILYLALNLPLAASLLFGILLSATDPVAVIAVFKEVGVGRQLSVLVEGESLFNDGIVIVGFGVLSALAAGSSNLGVGSVLVNVAVAIVGGVALGLVTGFVTAEMMRFTRDPLIDIALTTILAYGTYWLADNPLQGSVSPIISVVVAAIVLGNLGTRNETHISARSTMLITSFWEFVVFLINSAIFLLIGLEVAPDVLYRGLPNIAIATAVVLLARAIAVYGLRPLLNAGSSNVSLRWSHVMFWGGLHGAVSVALALSIPYAVNSRAQLVVMVFGVVLFSIIVQGLTLRPLLSLLGLSKHGDQWREFEEALGKMAIAEASVRTVNRMKHEHVISRVLARRLEERFENQVADYSHEVSSLATAEPSLAAENIDLMRYELAQNQKQTLLRLMRRGIIGEDVYSSLVSRVDEELEHPDTSDWELGIGLSRDLSALLSDSEEERELVEGDDDP